MLINDANFAELGKANPNAEAQRQKSAQTKQPTEVIKNPIVGSINDG
jgi:hypothetical protein